MFFGGFEFVVKSWHGNPFAEVKTRGSSLEL
jgi:hypothetical protein